MSHGAWYHGRKTVFSADNDVLKHLYRRRCRVCSRTRDGGWPRSQTAPPTRVVPAGTPKPACTDHVHHWCLAAAVAWTMLTGCQSRQHACASSSSAQRPSAAHRILRMQAGRAERRVAGAAATGAHKAGERGQLEHAVSFSIASRVPQVGIQSRTTWRRHQRAVMLSCHAFSPLLASHVVRMCVAGRTPLAPLAARARCCPLVATTAVAAGRSGSSALLRGCALSCTTAATLRPLVSA